MSRSSPGKPEEGRRRVDPAAFRRATFPRPTLLLTTFPVRMVPGPTLALVLLTLAACDPGVLADGDAGALDGSTALSLAPLSASPPPHPLHERPRKATSGLDEQLIADALDRAAGLPRLYGMIVARHGEILVERHYRGPGLDTPTNVKSASKSILSAIVGIAIEEGVLEGLDQPVAPFFAHYLTDELPGEGLAQSANGAGREAIRVHDLLTMQAGLESTSSGNYGRWVLSSDWVRHAITRPMVAEPGTRMIYSTGSSHLLSALLTEAAGRSTYQLARDGLADPLGIRLPQWLRDPQGIYFGGNDMHLSARDLLRFGELYRQGGTLDGRRILSREWVENSWEAHARSPRNGNVYGLGWWGRETNGYQVRFAWGYGGQFVFIVPALELTVVFTSDPVSPREGPHNRQLHRLLDELLVPAAIAGADA